MIQQTEIKTDYFDFVYFKDTKPIKEETYNQFKYNEVRVIIR